jgi:hypothetical protein
MIYSSRTVESSEKKMMQHNTLRDTIFCYITHGSYLRRLLFHYAWILFKTLATLMGTFKTTVLKHHTHPNTTLKLAHPAPHKLT